LEQLYWWTQRDAFAAILTFQRGAYFVRRLPNSMSAVRLPATHAGAGGQVSTLHCLRFPPN
jgi:hypothetical protein